MPYSQASMRPQSFDCGWDRLLDEVVGGLVASMRPQSFDCGWSPRKWRLALEPYRFNEAAVFRLRMVPGSVSLHRPLGRGFNEAAVFRLRMAGG